MDERKSLAKSIFLAALEIDSIPERKSFVAAKCGENEDLFKEVEKLLSHHAQAASFLESPPAQRGDDPGPTVAQSLNDYRGRQIGSYKIRELVGEGGMGAVCVAEQERPLRRKVALKVIKPGMDSRAVLGRFEAERNALALMNHPNIAKVLDAGTTDDSHPYFVMELVNGISITQYCDDQKLSIRERLKLFVDVCSAIQHAHQKGIIHRDIKPSNILVTELDGKPVAKVIDFGVAKALNQSLSEHSVYTAFQTVIGTPLYMSPEQATFSAVDVDTRSDVYSLGVLLYELLTGTTPFSTEEMKKAAQDEVFRLIREQEPPRPSHRISSLGQTVTTISQLRRAKPEQLGRAVEGDLDWIVMKALSKERARRYDSANRFADDINRYLKDELVEARPPSIGYQMTKFYYRNRQLAISTLAGFVLLSIGLIAAATSSYRLGLANELLRKRADELQYTQEQADEKAAELQARLNELWEILADRAMDAAFSGDLAVANAAIEQAIGANAPRDLTGSLRGISLLIAGQADQAIEQLESVVEEQPKSQTALAALSWAYLHMGMYGRHEMTQDNVQVLISESPEGNEYADFFVLLSEYVDGEVEHLETAISDLDDLIARKHNWGVAYLLRSRVRSELAMENRELDTFDESIIDFEKAFEQLGGNSFTCSEGVHVYTRAMDLADHLDVEHPEWSARVDALVSALRESTQNNFGLSVAATFYATRGDFEKAREIENALLPKIVMAEGVFTAAAELYEHDKSRIPDTWANDTKDVEKQLCVALSLACSSPTAQEMIKIREFVDRLISTEPSVTWFALAIDIACVLGDHEMRAELCKAAKKRPTFNDEWRWWKRYIDFHGGEIDEPTFRDRAEPFNHPLALVNYAIGLDALCNRNRREALEYFEKVEKSVLVTTWDYHNAKVFKRKLENGWLADEFQASK